jgi:hypothetical protein
MKEEENVIKYFNELFDVDSKLVKISQPKPKTKDIFLDIIKTYDDIITKSVDIHEKYHIDLFGYEVEYHKIIENLLFLKYGEEVYNIIMFYIHNRKDESDKHIPFMEEDGKEIVMQTNEDLYKYLSDNFSEIMK